MLLFVVHSARAPHPIIDVGLFQFPHMQKVAAQVAGPNGQFKRDLTPGERRLVLSN